MKAVILTAIATLVLATASVGNASGGRGRWEVAWRAAVCPRGFFCRREVAIRNNYGKAFRLARLLRSEGYMVWLIDLGAKP